MSDLFKFIKHPEFVDDRGLLVSLEAHKSVPFDIQRVYFLTNLKDSKRGFHAHRDLTQVLLCIKGSFTLTLDNGRIREDRTLDNPSTGVLITNSMWREMSNFSPDCVILVLASRHYDENDYIRNYDDFLESVK